MNAVEHALARRQDIKRHRLARLVDAPVWRVYRMVSGTVHTPPDMADRLAAFFDEPVDALFEERPFVRYRRAERGLFPKDDPLAG